MEKAKFYFGDVVVVEDGLIGCVLKTWHNERRGYHYEVYVRSYNGGKEYDEVKMQRYVVSKELSEDEMAWHQMRGHVNREGMTNRGPRELG